MFFHMYIAPGRGRQHTGDKILMTTERPFLFAHRLQVSKWSLRNLILYTFLMILYMYIALGKGQTIPWGQMLMSRESPYHFAHLLQVLKQSLWSLDFIYVFFMFFHMYIAPGRGRQHIKTKFWWKQKGLFSLPICCKFQNDLFEIWFYTHFSWFNTCI